jgi:polar amino acid transport system permease protein
VTAVVLGLLVGALALSPEPPDFARVWAHRGQYVKGLGLTLVATAFAYAIGLVLGVWVALARLSRTLWVRHLGDLYVEIVRGTPVMVLLMLAYWGIAPLLGVDDKLVVGILTLGVFAAAYTGEILRAGIESVERGQFEAARSLGLSRGQTLRAVVLPQAFKRMIPPLTSELIALTKETSLLWVIGVFELTAAAKATSASTYRPLEALLVAAVLYLCITIPLSFLARHLERRLGYEARMGIHL